MMQKLKKSMRFKKARGAQVGGPTHVGNLADRVGLGQTGNSKEVDGTPSSTSSALFDLLLARLLDDSLPHNFPYLTFYLNNFKCEQKELPALSKQRDISSCEQAVFALRRLRGVSGLA